MSNALQSSWRLITDIADRVSMGANALGTLTVLALVLVVNYDVIARGFFGAPFMGAVEVVQFTLVFIVFLQLPDVVRVGRLTRSDGFLLLIEMRMPTLALWLQRAVDAVAAIFMTPVAYAIWPEFPQIVGISGLFWCAWCIHGPLVADKARDSGQWSTLRSTVHHQDLECKARCTPRHC